MFHLDPNVFLILKAHCLLPGGAPLKRAFVVCSLLLLTLAIPLSPYTEGRKKPFSTITHMAGTAFAAKRQTSQMPAFVDLPVASAEATGIYTDEVDMNQDGVPDSYAGDGVHFQSDGDLMVIPASPRGFRILLPSAALSQLGAVPFDPTTEWTWIHIPDLLNATAPAVLGEPAPPNSNTSGSVFLYFRIDSNGDGKLTQRDEQYNLRWQGGIQLVAVTTTETGVIYELTTEPDLSFAELILRTNRGEVSKGFYYVPLTLRVGT